MRRLALLITALAMFGAMSIPVGAAGRPEFVGVGWNNAGSVTSTGFDNGGDWRLTVFVSYVYTDFLRYSDGTIVRPHTDVDVVLCAHPVNGGDCESPEIWLAGGTNLQGSPDASFTPLTSATLENVEVDVGEGGQVTFDIDWVAYGDRSHDVRTDDLGVSETWRRQATVTGTILVEGFPGEHPLSAFNNQLLTVGSDLDFEYGEISHSNAGISFGG